MQRDLIHDWIGVMTIEGKIAFIIGAVGHRRGNGTVMRERGRENRLGYRPCREGSSVA
jgi:hypothetical protein